MHRLLFVVFTFIFIASCTQSQDVDTLVFLTDPTYPPFESKEQNELMGFDIALAKEIAKLLNKEAQFQEVSFNSIMSALQSGRADAAISAITITAARAQHVDFSDPYYKDKQAVLFPKDAPITEWPLSNQRIVVQLGTTQHIWLQSNAPHVDIVVVDSNPQGAEILKARQADALFVNGLIADALSQENPELTYSNLSIAVESTGIAFPKGSKLRPQVNEALATLEKQGVLQELRDTYLSDSP